MRTLFILLFLATQSFAATTTMTGEKVLMGQKGSSTDARIQANVTASAKPELRYDKAAGRWKMTHNGTDYNEIGTNGGTVVAIAASNIDWSAGSVFTKTLAANTTFTFSAQTAGQVIVVRLTNTVSNYTVAWPGGVLWSGGTPPVQTVGAKSDVYTFVYDGSTVYGSVVQDF